MGVQNFWMIKSSHVKLSYANFITAPIQELRLYKKPNRPVVYISRNKYAEISTRRKMTYITCRPLR